MSLDALRSHVDKVFWTRQMEKYPDDAPWDRFIVQPGDLKPDMWRSFYTWGAKTSRHPLFTDPRNANDLLLDENLDTISPVYCGPKGGLLYFAKYHFHFEAIDELHTRMSVNVIDPKVVTFVSSFGIHGTPVTFQPVAPTTIEEYRLLRFIGATLNIEMPKPRLPAGACNDAAP